MSSFIDKMKLIILSDNGLNDDDGSSASSQTLDMLKPVVNNDEANNAIASDSSTTESLSAITGSLRVSTEENDFPTTDTISVYEIKKGDTLSTVAKLFGVSKNTIIWANDLKSNNLIPGDTIVILPMTGVKYIAKDGDTVSSIAKKYKADVDDIAKFNGISKDADLKAGDIILVPDGEISIATPITKKKTGTSKLLNSYSFTAPTGELIRPVLGGRKTQGLHGHNGIDIASSVGTPIMASGNGRVILAKMGGYNGGYGNMIIIAHDNNIQTVYAHLSAVYVTSGQMVTQGEVIGAMGNTGHSTGPHLHFEVRGAKNPF